LKNSCDPIGNQTRDHPACIAVPQLTTPPRARMIFVMTILSYEGYHNIKMDGMGWAYSTHSRHNANKIVSGFRTPVVN